MKSDSFINTYNGSRNLARLAAHWVSRDTILWGIAGSPNYRYSLLYSPNATLEATTDGVIKGGTEIELMYDPAGADEAIKARFPHLSWLTALKLSAVDVAKAPEVLKSEMAVIARDENGGIVDFTGLQIPGVLDDLYTYAGPLGITYNGNIPSLRLWAPTAKSVTLNLFGTSSVPRAEKMPMKWDKGSGTWSLIGKTDWTGKFYLYEVEVYVPATGQIEKNRVTDPYSISLSTNSRRSQIVDLRAASLKPQGWDALVKPPLDAPEDIVVYELHIRDFSAYDKTVPEKWRGTYKAFTAQDANGMRHLRGLAEAGLTHIHLLPTFDIASVNDSKSTWQTVD